MRQFNYKQMLYVTSLFILCSVIGMWSWNTLSDLFSLPHAQYRHVIAAFSLLFIMKWVFASRHSDMGQVHGGHHDHSNH